MWRWQVARPLYYLLFRWIDGTVHEAKSNDRQTVERLSILCVASRVSWWRICDKAGLARLREEMKEAAPLSRKEG